MKRLKELSLRIKNIKSIQKTTKVMQMVSATKLLQSQKKILNSKLYITKLHSIISSLMTRVNQDLLARILNISERDSYLVFVISSDRGLCGNFNASIAKLGKQYLNEIGVSDKKVNIVFFGKKALEVCKYKFDSKSILKVENNKKISLRYIEALVNDIDLNLYSNITILYSKFYNTFIQKPTLEKIKPWSKLSSLTDYSLVDLAKDYRYEYEPENIELILKPLTKDYILASLYSALLESSISENSARMVAMESANRNTKEILNKLTLLYNRSRQEAITTDLIEVTSGAGYV